MNENVSVRQLSYWRPHAEFGIGGCDKQTWHALLMIYFLSKTDGTEHMDSHTARSLRVGRWSVVTRLLYVKMSRMRGKKTHIFSIQRKCLTITERHMYNMASLYLQLILEKKILSVRWPEICQWQNRAKKKKGLGTTGLHSLSSKHPSLTPYSWDWLQPPATLKLNKWSKMNEVMNKWWLHSVFLTWATLLYRFSFRGDCWIYGADKEESFLYLSLDEL